jgi:UDP-glucose 4-epimerase
MHFAAFTIVPESVAEPLKYYDNNVLGTRALIDAALAEGVDEFIFSSSAAVYGSPPGGIAAEDSPTVPINPYRDLQLDQRVDAPATWRQPRRCAQSRYALQCRRLRSQWSNRPVDAASHLAHQGGGGTRRRQAYPRVHLRHRLPDARRHGIRDYIHVEDLASAHLSRVAGTLRAGGKPVVLDIG